jgi:hypothetical protein
VSVSGTGGSVSITGTGGSTGAGGASTFTDPCVPTSATISDMEDGNSYYKSDGCPGSWFLSTSGGGMVTVGTANAAVTPVDVADNSPSTKAIHVTGMGQSNTGTSATMITTYGNVSLTAALNADATHNDTTAGALNATAYTGIKFKYKLTSTAEVHLQVSDADTDPAGKRCSTTGGLPTSCYNHAAVILPPAATWTQQMVPFTSLMQIETFGMSTASGASFPKAAIYQVAWKVLFTGITPLGTWDIWVDDLSFY